MVKAVPVYMAFVCVCVCLYVFVRDMMYFITLPAVNQSYLSPPVSQAAQQFYHIPRTDITSPFNVRIQRQLSKHQAAASQGRLSHYTLMCALSGVTYRHSLFSLAFFLIKIHFHGYLCTCKPTTGLKKEKESKEYIIYLTGFI